jgi:hypothetical protein
MNENSDQVTGPVKELLSLNYADSAPTDPFLGAEKKSTTAFQTEESRARTGARPLSSWLICPFVAEVRCLALVPLQQAFNLW